METIRVTSSRRRRADLLSVGPAELEQIANDQNIVNAITPQGEDTNAYGQVLSALVDARPVRFKSTRVPALAMREIMKSPEITVVGSLTKEREVKAPRPVELINPKPPKGELEVRTKTAAARGDYLAVDKFEFKCARSKSCSKRVSSALCVPVQRAVDENNIFALEQALAGYRTALLTGSMRSLCTLERPNISLQSSQPSQSSKLSKSPQKALGEMVQEDAPREGELTLTAREKHVLDALNAYRHTFGEIVRLGGVKLVMSTDEELETFERARVSEKKRQLETLRHAMKMDAKFAVSRQYLQIVDDMLGRERGHAVRRAVQKFAVVTPQQLLAKLSKKERGIVESERRNREEHMRALINNRCPHLSAVRALRRRPTLQRLNHVLEFQSNDNETGWLRCKNCTFPLICPHVVELLKLRLDPAKHAPDISSAMRKFQSKLTRPDTTIVFCKICNEQLRDSANDGLRGVPIKLQQTILDDDEQVREAWSDAMRVIDGRRRPLLDFDRPIGSSALAGDVSRQALHLTELMFQQREYRRRQAVPGFRRLITVVFIYASLYNAVMSGQVHILGHRKSAPDVIAKTMLSHLVTVFGQLVSNLADITHEQIAKQFMDAYQVVLASVGKQTVVPSDALWEMCNEVAFLNPFFHATRAAQHAEARINNSDNPARAAADRFAKIMGRTVTDILKSTLPEELRGFCRALLNGGSIEYPEATIETVEPLWTYRIPSIQVYRNTPGRKEAMRKMKDLAKRPSLVEKEVPHNAPLWIGGREAPLRTGDRKKMPERPGVDAAFRLLQEYSSVHNNAMWRAYTGVLAEARHREEKHRLESSLQGAPHVSMRLGVCNELASQESIKIASLSEVYDEDGRKHKWSIALWGGKEFTGRELYREIPRMKSSPLEGLKFEGVKCAVCGVLHSETSKLSINKVRKALKRRTESGALFSFFAVRCPEGGAHEWADGRCDKCGLEQSTLDTGNFQTKEARAYFDKYAHQLSQIRGAEENHDLLRNKPASQSKAPQTKKASVKDDPKFLQEAAALLQVAPETLKSIGSCENAPIGKSCDGNCSVTTTSRNVQGRVQQFCFDYSKAFHEDSKGLAPPEEIRAPASVNGLCYMFVEVFRKSERGQEVAKKIMHEILKSESRLRAPGEFSWSVFGAEDSRGGNINAGVSTDTSEAGEDVDMERGEVTSRIANENMDIEEDIADSNL